jgi:hypothetical protein
LVKLRGASLHLEGASHAIFRAFRFIGVSISSLQHWKSKAEFT